VLSVHGHVVRSTVQVGNKQAEEDARRVGQYSATEKVESAQQLAGRLLTTVYMGTVNSSRETRDRAASLTRQVLSLEASPDTESGLSIRALGSSSQSVFHAA
jgi:NAD+ synthase (glutamine-hydrolysing)